MLQLNVLVTHSNKIFPALNRFHQVSGVKAQSSRHSKWSCKRDNGTSAETALRDVKSTSCTKLFHDFNLTVCVLSNKHSLYSGWEGNCINYRHTKAIIKHSYHTFFFTFLCSHNAFSLTHWWLHLGNGYSIPQQADDGSPSLPAFPVSWRYCSTFPDRSQCMTLCTFGQSTTISNDNIIPTTTQATCHMASRKDSSCIIGHYYDRHKKYDKMWVTMIHILHQNRQEEEEERRWREVGGWSQSQVKQSHTH